MRINIILFFLLMAGRPLMAQVKSLKVSSPDQSVVYTLSVQDGRVTYMISRKGIPVIDPSHLGLQLDNSLYGAGNSLKVLQRKSVNHTYATRGFHSLATDHYNLLYLKVMGMNAYEIAVKVFNDGVAFQYILANTGKSEVKDDLTEFSIPAGSTVWSQDNITTYEGNYAEQKIEAIKAGQIAGPPLTVQLAGEKGYASITEAGLTDFAGMSLLAKGSRIFKANLTGLTYKNAIVKTPWRVILIGGTLNQLVNSDIITNVSATMDPELFPKGYATDWIKPGKSVWSWLAGNGDVTFDNMKRFSAWAGKLGFSYNLVDEGWSKWQSQCKDKWAMMKDLVDYSHKKNVGIWVWKAYPDRGGEPGIRDAAARLAFFQKCKEIGIAGLKIDFFDTEAQEVIDFYQSALKDAAQFQLMLNFHGANKPTGEIRTWPNEMSREAVIGLENNTNWARHNTILPFTRFLAGHADYTPLSFTDNVKGTTLTHQVATVAAFNSAFMCLGVDPEVLLKSKVKHMVQQIPVTWDETIILPQSKIGELVLIAKRSDKDWYLIALNGEKSREITVDLNFLVLGIYHSEQLRDVVSDASDVSISTGNYSKDQRITLNLSSGGGFIGRFYP